MNILLIGSGGREHALAWKLAQSPQCGQLFITPGNGGTGKLGTHVVLDVADHHGVIAFCKLQGIALVVVGPEAPLVDGLADSLRAAGIAAFGPSKAAAQLEGSKAFTKALCDAQSIPTASYAHFTDLASAKAHVEAEGAPIVIKADGLAAGKGVTVAETTEQALTALDDCFSGEFGEAGAEVVIEECLVGEEASMFFLSDGTRALPFGTAQDHKRVGDGDTGPNTGGMGAYSPAPAVTDAVAALVMNEIVRPTLSGMADLGTPFIGVLYAGLMLTDDGPKLIEYNVRFGDPECQVLMMRLQSDLVDVLYAAAKGDLSDQTVSWTDKAALTVVLASNGYPASYQASTEITSLPEDRSGHMVFHAGTTRDGDRLLATGGRVLNVTALGKTVKEAQAAAYTLVDGVAWPEGFCRRDIGWRAVEREVQ